jgi:hypothetical protein
MFSWLASLFVVFLHGNPAHVTSTVPAHPTGTKTIHALDTSSSPTSADSPAINDGWPTGG